MSKNTPLFSDFSSVDLETWQEKIKKDLKGKTFEDLIWKSIDGYEVPPFLHKENSIPNDGVPGKFPYSRGVKTSNNTWLIRQDFSTANPKETRRKVLEALANGVQSIGLNKLQSKEDLNEITEGVFLEMMELNISAVEDSMPILEYLNTMIQRRGLAPASITGCLEQSPLGQLTTTGGWVTDEEKDYDTLAECINYCQANIPHYRTVEVRGDHFHYAGATIIEEIAFSLAQAHEYLHELIKREVAIDEITGRLQFTLATGPDYFPEIAKFRAIRMLWAQIVAQYDPQHHCSHATYIRATTSQLNASKHDEHNNLLRGTTAAMSAILGGCDSLCILPFDQSFQQPTDFSERLARNIQHILREESYLDKVIDPAAGSYYIEHLTDLLAQKAWSLFQEVEAKGGYVAALKEGFIQEKIESSAKQKQEAFSDKKLVLVGINKYANSEEITTTFKPVPVSTSSHGSELIQPITLLRLQ